MKTAWNRDRKTMAEQEGGQVCWFQYLLFAERNST